MMSHQVGKNFRLLIVFFLCFVSEQRFNVAADGHLAMTFMKALSNFYQGLPLAPEQTPAFVLPSPAPLPPISLKQLYDLLSAVKSDPRYKPNIYAETEAYERMVGAIEDSIPVNIRISAKQMGQLKALAAGGFSESNGVQVSRQDAVTALLVTTMNKFLDVKVDHVRSVWNVSQITFHVFPPTKNG